MRPSTLAVAASVGALLVATAIATGSAMHAVPPVEPLTRIGVSMVRPEHEMPAYVAGVVLALGLVVVTGMAGFGCWRGGGRMPRITPWILACAALTVAVAPLYPYIREHAHLAPVLRMSELGAACGVALAAAACAWLSQRYLPEAVELPALGTAPRRPLVMAFDLLMAAAIVLAVGVHPLEHLASRIYINERFFHWEHFLFTPALGHMSGLRLGTDLYSQYGVAYPALYGWLAGTYAWGYTPALGIAVALGIVYYLFAYGFLRGVTRRALPAAAGLVLLLALSQFPWTFFYTRTYTVWQIPSATLLRSPLDLLVVFCVWRHAATGRARWLWAAGLATGASLTVALDVGLLLAALVATYVLLSAYRGLRDGNPGSAGGVLAAGSVSAGLGIAFAAVAYGLVSGAFAGPNPAAAVTRLMAGVTASAAGGVGANHLLGSIHWLEWLYFVLMVAVYVAAAGRWLAAGVSGARPAPAVTASGLLGLYGLMRGIFFVWNTVPQVLFRGVSPLPLVLALWMGEWLAAGETTPAARGTVSRRSVGAACVLTGCVLLLGLNPSFRDYPSLLRAIAGRSAGTAVLAAGPVPDIPLPRSRAKHAAVARMGLAACRALSDSGGSTVILHDHATFYYWYAGLPLWGDNPNVYYLMYTRRQLAAFLARLEALGPDHVLLARHTPGESLAPLYADVHAALRRHVQACYERVGTAGEFDVYVRPAAPGLEVFAGRADLLDHPGEKGQES